MSGNHGSDLIERSRDRRKLIVVLYADMVGYSRLIGLDDAGTLERLRALRRYLIDPAIDEHGGRIVQTGGDSLLIVFDSIDGAVRCAVEVQQQVPILDRDQPPDRAIRFRVGINIGDAIADGTDLHGDAVNIAARIQSECPPGGVCVTRAVRDHVRGRLNLSFEEIGALNLKNIAYPVETFVLRLDAVTTTPRPVARSLEERASEERASEAFPPCDTAVDKRRRSFWHTARTLWRDNGRRPAAVSAPEAAAERGGTRPKGGQTNLAAVPPRLSIVVLPFENLSGDPKDDYLADAITDDLTSDLSLIPDVSVIARESANAYRGQPKDVKRIGEELHVRYVLKGNVRRFGSMFRLNVQMISGETGALLWSDRFDEVIGELAAGQEQVVRRMKDEVGVCLIEIENARCVRERPTNPDAFDLVLRVRSIRNQPPSLQRDDEALALLERCLVLDPNSLYAMTYIAFYLSQAAGRGDGWENSEDMQRAERLLSRARAIAPDSPVVLNAYVLWLRTVGRYAEVVEVCPAGHPNASEPNTGADGHLPRACVGARPGQGMQRKGLPLKRKQTGSTPTVPGGTSATGTSAGTRCCWAGTPMRSDISNGLKPYIRRMTAHYTGNTAAWQPPMRETARSRRHGNTSSGPIGVGPMIRSAVALRRSC